MSLDRRYFYSAETISGDFHEFYIDARDETTANVEAKLEVESWLVELGDTFDNLYSFNLIYSRRL